MLGARNFPDVFIRLLLRFSLLAVTMRQMQLLTIGRVRNSINILCWLCLVTILLNSLSVNTQTEFIIEMIRYLVLSLYIFIPVFVQHLFKMVDRFVVTRQSGGRVWCEVTTIMVLVKTLLKLCYIFLSRISCQKYHGQDLDTDQVWELR